MPRRNRWMQARRDLLCIKQLIRRIESSRERLASLTCALLHTRAPWFTHVRLASPAISRHPQHTRICENSDVSRTFSCVPGTGGPYCSICTNNSEYFKTETSECLPCEPIGNLILPTVLAVVLAAVCLVAFLALRRRRRKKAERSSKSTEAWRSAGRSDHGRTSTQGTLRVGEPGSPGAGADEEGATLLIKSR